MIFPWAEEDCGVMDTKYKLFVMVCEATINPNDFTYANWKGNGRHPASRLSIFKAFIFKATMNLSTTKDLIQRLKHDVMARRLCGWSGPSQIPSEARFSRVMAEFAERGFTEKRFEDLVVTFHQDVSKKTISYDSAPIAVRTHAVNKKRDITKTDAVQIQNPNRLEMQFHQDAQKSLSELPIECAWGCKRDSQGNNVKWKGGKYHVAVTTDGIPVAFAYTSASLHDSQVIIPLIKTASKRIHHQFDLADAAYDAKWIRAASRAAGNVAIIDRNKRNSHEGTIEPMSEYEAAIYKDRSSVERYFSHLIDAHGGRTVRVRDPKKVILHLLFGTLVIVIEQLMRVAMLC